MRMMTIKFGPITKNKMKSQAFLYNQSTLQQQQKKIKEKERVYLNSTIFITDSFN